MKSTEARPFFRILAGIVAIIGAFGVFMFGAIELNDGNLARGITAFVGGTLFTLAMLLVAVTGRVPTLLAWFLAPPSAWSQDDER